MWLHGGSFEKKMKGNLKNLSRTFTRLYWRID